jgi:hypothetical protein
LYVMMLILLSIWKFLLSSSGMSKSIQNECFHTIHYTPVSVPLSSGMYLAKVITHHSRQTSKNHFCYDQSCCIYCMFRGIPCKWDLGFNDDPCINKFN